MLGGDQQHDAARLPKHERAVGIDRVEDLFDRDCRGSKAGKHVTQAGVDLFQAVSEFAFSRVDGTEVQAGTAVRLHRNDAVARVTASRVYAHYDHDAG